MRYGLAVVTSVAWALWFGGLMALFLFVSTLFRLDRPTAVVAAPRMFAAFERYQVMLAAVAAVAALAWWRASDRPRRVLGAIVLIIVLSAAGAVVSTTVVTPRMERLRLAGQSGGPEFRKLHGRSMMLYTATAGLLAVNGFLLPAAMLQQRAHGPAPRSAPPV